jgi:hypothetical protein
MSFDIFLQCFQDGQVATWQRSVVEEVFGGSVTDRDNDRHFMRVEFPDGGGSDIYIDNADDMDGMMFNHSGGLGFFDALWELANRIIGCVYWPAVGPSMVITNAATLTHLPPDMLEACGPPVIAKSGADIIAAIERS